MKKILLFLILFLVSDNALALTYYSDYYELSDWTTNKPIEENNLKIEEEKRYLWYKENRVDGSYTEDSDYPYIDYDNFIEEEVCSSENIDGTYEKDIYYYKKVLPIRYIHFTNLSGSYNSFRITELKVIHAGKDLNYQVVNCNGCNATFLDYIHNGKHAENMSSVSNGGSFTIDLGDYYYINEIDIYFGIYDAGANEELFNIYITRDSNLNKIYYEYRGETNYNYSNASETTMIPVYYYSFNPVSLEYASEIKTTEEILETFITKVRKEKEYCSLQKRYLHYKLEKHYLNEYKVEGTIEYPNKDIESELTFYKTFSRDYLIIPDVLVITDKTTDIYSMIKSNLPFEIKDDINLEKNGTYQIEIDSPIKKVISNVTVDLEENRKILDLEMTIENQKTQIINKNKQMENLLLELESLKELNRYLENQIKIIKQEKTLQNENYLKEIEQLNNKIVNNVCEQVEVEKSSVINFEPYLGIILVLSGIILTAIIVIKKNS